MIIPEHRYELFNFWIIKNVLQGLTFYFSQNSEMKPIIEFIYGILLKHTTLIIIEQQFNPSLCL